MRIISATDAKQGFAAMIDTAQREPVMIRRHDRNVAVLLSAEEYEEMRSLYARKLERLCNRVSAQAKARGLNEAILTDMLRDE